MGLVDTLSKEFYLQVEWLAFEIHPETPPEGMPLTTMFPRADAETMARRLNSMGALYGITFRKVEHIANSRLSLEAGEFAKQQGRFDQFHHAVFDAYFAQGKDIGSLEVLTDIGRGSGLDAEGLGKALRAGTYHQTLESVKEETSRLAVTAAPTFIINDQDRIVGAQPIEVFREKLNLVEAPRSKLRGVFDPQGRKKLS
jgi:predicted DsbA family dithiol-disulfide isomerase